MHFKEAKGILSAKNGMNIYRGCTHGCIYCDSRSLCYDIKHDFEDIEVKVNAPELLKDALSRKRKKCMISTGAMCDHYTPLEHKLRYTRSCIEIIEKSGFGLAIQSKSASLLRDLDMYNRINTKAKCVVEMTLTTFDDKLTGIIEPHVSLTRERFEALKELRDSGISTVVWLSPILPFINDSEENLRGILDYCIEARVYGIICFGMGLTLRQGNREYFYRALDASFPGLKHEYINRYGLSYEVTSPNNTRLMRIFHDTCERHQIVHDIQSIFAYLARLDQPSFVQPKLF